MKIKAPDLALRIQNNPPSVVVEDERQVPEAYREEVTMVKLLKSEIGKALKAGEAVAGARLEQTTRLVIG